MSSEIVVFEEPTVPAITPKRRSILTISNEQLERLKTLAEMMAISAFDYSKDGKRQLTKGDIFIKMLKGIEVGLEPIASLDLIDIISGKPTLKPQGMLALAWGSGQMETLNITDDGTACKVTIKRQGAPAHTEVFSADDAKSMGLASRDSWKKQPAVMRKWRAVSAACRIVFPDIIQGMYIPEELAPDNIEFDSNGEIEANGHKPEVAAAVIEESAAPEAPKPGPEKIGGYLVSYVRYFIPEKGQAYLEFTADTDEKMNMPVVRGYGRSTRIKQMLNEMETGLYRTLGLANYSDDTETTEWKTLLQQLTLTYTKNTSKEGEYNTITGIDLEELEF